MLFFGSKRKKATEAATAAMQPLIASMQTGGTSTFDFWDPYVIGFLGFTGSFFANNAAPKISPMDLGLAMQDAFTNACEIDGSIITSRMIELSDAQDPQLAQAQQDAMTSVLYGLDLLDNEDDNELVKSASRLMTQSGIPIDDFRAAVGGAIISLTLGLRFRQLREVRNA